MVWDTESKRRYIFPAPERQGHFSACTAEMGRCCSYIRKEGLHGEAQLLVRL